MNRVVRWRRARAPHRPVALLAVVLVARAACAIAQDPHAAHAPAWLPLTELPYLDHRVGRDDYLHAARPVNAFRLYDFYARQADYHRTREPSPAVLPAFPGIDGGAYGHWGRFSKNDHRSDRWGAMDVGSVIGGVLHGAGSGRMHRFGHGTLARAIAARLGGDGALAVAFDPSTLSLRACWRGGFVRHGEARFGLIDGMYRDGDLVWSASDGVGWSRDAAAWPAGFDDGATRYRGYYRHGPRVVFSYSVHGTEVLDAPWVSDAGERPALTRTLEFPRGLDEGLRVQLFAATGRLERRRFGRAASLVVRDGDLASVFVGALTRGTGRMRLDRDGDARVTVELEGLEDGTVVDVWHTTADAADTVTIEAFVAALIGASDIRAPSSLIHGGPPRWRDAPPMTGALGAGDHPWVLDTIPVPLDNPYRSIMFLSGHDFFANGDAAVCTMMGDVWLVRGLDATLKRVTWRRFASGLNQPLGLEIVDDRVHVLGRDQITVLRDLDGDGEADFHECFCNAFPSSAGGHDYNTGLQRDGAGNFYFATRHAGVIRVSPDGAGIRVLAEGLRNPNGIGVRADGVIVTSSQEGEWTPASMVVEVREGEFYGHGATPGREIHPPLCFVPRGVDNSTGSQVFVDSDRWGIPRGQLVSFSYGYGTHYLVLRDAPGADDGARAQGAVVPLRGEFLAGAHRGRFHPRDGQLYVTGADGWGNYALQDGCFQRVRYTGRAFHLPLAFGPRRNGLTLRFSQPLDRASATDPGNWFAQQWRYVYSPAYGSAEYSARRTGVVGHDPLEIRSVHLSADGHSVFLEMPDIEPVMQMHVRARIAGADGQRFACDVFPTVLRLDQPFTDFAGYAPAPAPADKPTTLDLQVEWPRPRERAEPAPGEHPGRPIELRAVSGLRYDVTELRVRSGELVSLTLHNADVMPHNWVLIAAGASRRVGEAANRMVADPDAAARHYVPALGEVLQHTRVVVPGESDTITFHAPDRPGSYPFLCTFPGHWQLMNGRMIVE